MAVTLTQLAAFVCVVRRGSVTAAAEELFVTQPSVSAAVAALERELGGALFRRTGRRLEPTAMGSALLPFAERLLSLEEEARSQARQALGRGGVELGVLLAEEVTEDERGVDRRHR
jgi:DNA-binding transcriptional LysR family regulator